MHPLTCSCFFRHLLGRLFLLAISFHFGICLPSLWSPPFPLHAPAVIYLLSCQDAALTLLTIWCSGQTVLFLYLLAKAAVAFLPTTFFVALRPLFPFQQAQYVSLKPALFCKLFAGFGSTNKSTISFLLFDSRLILIAMSSQSFHLVQSLWQIW